MINENEILLTIVIPYYKTYELTYNLLKSIEAQWNKNVEVILIDDGCNEMKFDIYYGKWLNIIHQENGGVSKARNKGMELAKGKYVAFIDSDDMIMSNYIETLLELIDTRNEDIIYFNWLDVNKNNIVVHPSNPAVWKAIYKREILPHFDETLKAREDYYFQQELEKGNYSKYYYDKVLYVYNSGRENSLSWKDKRGEL